MVTRLANEAKLITNQAKEENGILHCGQYGDSICLQTFTFKGPEETPLADQQYEIHVFLPERYPFEPPEVFFARDPFHPNVDEKTGRVHVSFLSPDSWNPSTTLLDIVKILRNLLAKPCVPVNASATMSYCTDRSFYFKEVRSRRSEKKAEDEEQ